MNKALRFLCFAFVFQGCSSNPPDWLLRSHHALSPDGEVYVYQHSAESGDSVRVSLSTYHLSPTGGGAGLFDIVLAEDHPIDLR